MTDWSAGAYETTAAQLEPAAALAVDALGLQPGESVVDVACGTGNAALLAAQAGALVTGVDLAGRLLDVARHRAAAAGLTRTCFVEGDATDLPVADGHADAAVSVFGVVFAEPEPAAAELLRVVRPGGRIALTAWRPAGPFVAIRDWIGEQLGRSAPHVTWAPDHLGDLFAPHPVTVTEHRVAFGGPDLDAYVDELVLTNPIFVEAREALAAARPEVDLRAELRARFAEANEAAEGVLVHSPYVLARVERR